MQSWMFHFQNLQTSISRCWKTLNRMQLAGNVHLTKAAEYEMVRIILKPLIVSHSSVCPVRYACFSFTKSAAT